MDEFAAYLSDVAAIEDDLFKQQQESNERQCSQASR